MSNAIKCIIRQSWTNRDKAGNLIERRDNVYVTNEDGTPHIYQSIAEARAEIRANYGRDANRAGILHTHTVDEYSGNVHDGYIFIVREDADEYTEATRAAEPRRTMNEIEHTASDAVSQLMSAYAETIGCSAYDISGDVWQAAYHVAAVDIIPEPERPAGYTEASADDRATVSAIVDTITRAEIIASIEDPEHRAYIEAEADRYQWTPEETRANIEYRATIRAANRAAAAFMSAYAEASGESLTEDDDETRAAYLVARDEITGTSERASDYDRAMVAGMVQTIAAAVAYMRPFAAADRAARSFVAAYAEAIGDTIAESDPEARAAYQVARAEIAGSHASDYDRAMVRDMLEAIADRANSDAEPAPVYQRYELEAYLGDPDAYDVEAIEAEATAYDPKSGARVWSAFGEDLAAIAERHELYSYAPAV